MNSRSRVRQSLLDIKIAFTKNRSFRSSAVVLILMLIADVLPVGAVSTSFSPNKGRDLQTASTLTFVANADAYVEELHPSANNGTTDYLQVESANNRNSESYIRFAVSGVTGSVQSAQLRVYTTVNSQRMVQHSTQRVIHGRRQGSPGTIAQDARAVRSTTRAQSIKTPGWNIMSLQL